MTPKEECRKNERCHLDSLQQFVYFLVAQLLSQGGEHILYLSYRYETVTILVKDLESSNEFLCE